MRPGGKLPLATDADGKSGQAMGVEAFAPELAAGNHRSPRGGMHGSGGAGGGRPAAGAGREGCSARPGAAGRRLAARGQAADQAVEQAGVAADVVDGGVVLARIVLGRHHGVTGGAAAARRLRVLGPPLPPPEEETRLEGWRHGLRHSLGRDSKAISHHYDVGNDFYRMVLGPTMVYSCARFVNPGVSLERAQTSKLDVICRKLGLDAGGPRQLLDVGCGSLAFTDRAYADNPAVNVVLLDQSAKLLSMARKRLVRRLGRVPDSFVFLHADVLRMPDNSFGTVPTPAIVAPIEFSMRLADYQALGGHMAYVRPLVQALATGAWHVDEDHRRTVFDPHHFKRCAAWQVGFGPTAEQLNSAHHVAVFAPLFVEHRRFVRNANVVDQRRNDAGTKLFGNPLFRSVGSTRI